MKSHIFQALKISACIFLSACSSFSTVTRSDQSSFYDQSLVIYIASQGKFPVVVAGNPFSPQHDIRSLVSGLRLPGFYPQVQLEQAKTLERGDGYMVLIFDPSARVVNRNDFCIGTREQTLLSYQREEKVLRVQAALCIGEHVASQSYIEMSRPDSPVDASFRREMVGLFNVLLPTRSLHHGADVD